MAKCSPLHKVTDDARWDTEDLFGRLCILAHAAFVYAGFHPSAVQEATPWSLSRSYSVMPPAAAVERPQDAAAVVLRLFRQGGRRRLGNAHMSLRAHVVAANNGGRYMERREQLRHAALKTALLAGGLNDAARAIRAPGSAAECLWKLLTDGICRSLFLHACEANGVPVMPDFASLPRDTKMAILEKLDDGKDVAMSECASKELRDIVADHDSDLWMPKYHAIINSLSYCCDYHVILARGDTPLIRWKERYVKAKAWHSKLCPPLKREQSELNHPMLHIPPIHPRTIEERMILLGMILQPRSIHNVVHEAQKPTVNTVSIVTRRRAVVDENRRRRSDKSGAVHSPSSRYNWKHR
ncbi:unnamed protein product [Urochloa humidicola]